MTTHTETQRVVDIQKRLDAATKGPWSYRPYQYDDWGYVRQPDGYVVAVGRAGNPVDLDEYRERGDDPYAHNGIFIAHAREDVPFLLALLTRQQEEIEARDAKIAELMEAAKGSAVIVNTASEKLKHVRAVLRNQTCLLGSTLRAFSPDGDQQYKGLTDFEIAISPAVRAALEATK